MDAASIIERAERVLVAPGTGTADAVHLADEQSFGVRAAMGAGPVAPAVEVTADALWWRR